MLIPLKILDGRSTASSLTHADAAAASVVFRKL